MEQLLNDFSPGLFIMQCVILLILIILLGKFAWKPIINSLDEREEGIKNALEAAKKAKEEMENLQADNEKMLAEARAERDGMLKEAREMKDKMIADAKEAASAQGAAMLEQAKTAIESEKKAAVTELKNQVAAISLEIAQKVVKTELSDKEKQMAQVEKMLDEVTLN
ncbi:F-type H+-transporting ATPase subunit b [Pustulibacterium marinum]|uniref:ATP synthase subunit b n=1 Tax=Pustulibacterium marinum TaxID=1224947 RepID=A0A1I7EU18_9FLAO|nr:F0F1 ATP synthase subunit B [Pustulibacterium marinum]SFU27403.1 F-type H+-transporting ATPase subunit b [Pustulibacterium marinum]